MVDGEKHWRLTREGRIAPVTDETLAFDRRWYQGHIYRTLHRIAKRDPALRLSTGTGGRLEVHEGASRIAWYLLDRSSQPYRYGAHDDEVGGGVRLVLQPVPFSEISGKAKKGTG